MTEFVKWSFLLHIASTLAMVGLIWFVQIVHYPLFSRVGHENFQRYETDHQRLVIGVVAPGMLIELATAMILLWSPPPGISGSAVWLGVLLLAMIWLTTYRVQVPQHAALALAYDPDVQRRLVNGNWIRTTAWSGRGLLVVWMMAQLLSAATFESTSPKTNVALL